MGDALTDPLVDPAFYAGDPFPHYARLREEAPVAWCEAGKFWAASTHAAVHEVSVDSARFCSAKGILAMEIGVDYETPPTMMHTDPPAHTAYRSLVQPGFRPSVVRDLAERVEARTSEIVDALPAGEVVDVVQALAVPLPLLLIADVLGVPTDDLDKFYEWSEAAIPGATDIEPERQIELMGECWAYLLAHALERRTDPREDVVSILAHTEIDGRQLTDDELVMFLNQLLIAGNETTRNAISGGLAAFGAHADQWERLRADRSLIPTAIEEILRWTTPVISFMRTATADTTLAGSEILAGDPVLMLYQSANRDPLEFGSTAEVFDIGRTPNHHLAFGFGAHFCIGAALARLELRVLLEHLLDRFSALEPAGPVVRSASPVIAGVTGAPMRLL